MNHSAILISPLLILGMHRSGTSLITRLVNLLGSDLGSNLMPPSADNIKGYWENIDVVEAHEALLNSLDSPWTALTPLPGDWQQRPMTGLVRQRLQGILADEFKPGLVAIKDPRLCRVLPLWQQVLETTNRRPKIIMAVRHPLDVARSLEKRDGMPITVGLLLWLRHVLEAERDSRSLPRIVVDYDDIVADWRQVVDRITKTLAVEWPVSPESIFAEARDFVAQDMRHHHAASTVTTMPAGEVGALAEMVYRALCAETISVAVLDAALVRLDDWTSDPLGLVNALGITLHRALESDRQLVAAQQVEQDLRAAVGLRDQSLIGRDEEYRQHIQSYHDDRMTLLNEIKRLENVESSLLQQAAIREEEKARLADETANEIANRDQHILGLAAQVSGLLQSTSWRITAPLRWVRHNIRRVKSALWLMVSLQKLPLIPDEERVGALRGKFSVLGSFGVTQTVVAGGMTRLKLDRAPVREAAAQGIKTVLPPLNLAVFVDFPGDHTHTHRLVFAAGQCRASIDLLVEILPRRLEFAVQEEWLEEVGAIDLGLKGKYRRVGNLWRWPMRALKPLWRLVRNPRPLVHGFMRAVAMAKRGEWRNLGVAIRRRLVRGVQQAANLDYHDWVRLYDSLDDQDRVMMIRRIAMLPWRPRFSVLMPVYNPPIDVLREAIESVITQIYPDWELCIVDDASTDPAVTMLLETMAATDKRIKWRRRDQNGHISRTTNDCLALASGDFAAMLDHDDVLRPHALYMMAEAICQAPDAVLLYSDEDKIDEKGERYAPYFKSAWNYDLFLSQGYLNHLTVIKLEAVRTVGGWRVGFEGAQDHDLLLRIIETIRPEQIIHIPMVLYHWRAIATSTASSMGAKNTAAEAGERAITEHLQRIGSNGIVGPGVGQYQLGAWYRVQYPVPEPAPLVSLIIPTRDKLELLRGCMDGLLRRTDYPAIEIIIVDNNSEEQETLDYLARVVSDSRVRVIRDERPFNYSALNNGAVIEAKGSIIGLINNDIEVIHPEWLTEMVSHVMRPQIGCVGAMLYYADDRIQHAGVICGLGGVAGHSHKYFQRNHPGYFGRLGLVQQLSAVTAACLLVRRSVYEQVGGLDEQAFSVAFNDVDFCLKVRAAGYVNLWTPYAELYHLESASRGQEDSSEKIARFQGEMAEMKKSWEEILNDDPAYSPNLTQDFENFSLAFPPRVRKPWDTLSQNKNPGVLIRRA